MLMTSRLWTGSWLGILLMLMIMVLKAINVTATRDDTTKEYLYGCRSECVCRAT
jgi:hypothetical protein